jgi:SNF2 family DNA or RNA helicase
MARLEDLTAGASVRGIEDDAVTIVDAKWWGTNCIEIFFKNSAGKPDTRILYRDDEGRISLNDLGNAWGFDGDGSLFRLASEAYRIHLAHLFDPLLAIHTSDVDPYPHQITAVYGSMLPRQPLRFLLADDPGAGKTIMTGLLIKELIARGDLRRALIVSPGSLVEQWQDELHQRFDLTFDILTTEAVEAAATGNWFAERNLVICRLDKLSRNEDLKAKLEATDWDLIVVDEAHKMSASFFGNEINYTKRYRLGQLLSRITRHFLLLTATPHNGKPEDFHLFLALLDSDRFEGKYRQKDHLADVSDLMRRMVKESLLKFDGTRLFPERRAYTVGFELSPLEDQLYREVTSYVGEEFNRADKLDETRRGTVGFALTILQRRLASSPEAIYQSLRRRRERLENRLRDEKAVKSGEDLSEVIDELEDLDEIDDLPEAEIEPAEETVVDQATAARTIAELETEIKMLRQLETLALQVRRSGSDRKWDELSSLLQHSPEMLDAEGNRRKLVIFTEHRDTLNYLGDKLRGLLGRAESVVMIHGSMAREERKAAQESFTQDKNVFILLATDAAGEGINLQRAHLMVNYDLPWNPNRLEQRFGRIHRIGQTEVCHLWNLLAENTREGDVYRRLLDKLDQEREALGGAIFDILGQLFHETRLRDLLIDAIRYGDSPEVRQKLAEKIDNLTDVEHCRELIDQHGLTSDALDVSQVRAIRDEMERAEAVRLQPYFIESFFLEAFRRLGGSISEREPRRFEITHVPAILRQRDRQLGTGAPVIGRYERVTFEKKLRTLAGKPMAGFLTPGHPLLAATIDVILERHRTLLRQGTLLLDPNDFGDELRALFYLEHAIQDGRSDPAGNRRIISRQLQFVSVNAEGVTAAAGPAPFLDYRPLTPEEQQLVQLYIKAQDWLRGPMEEKVIGRALETLVPEHLQQVRERKQALVQKTLTAVKDRLTAEMRYWDRRANELKDKELAGKFNSHLNSAKARQRADELEARLKLRTTELNQEKQISALPPVVVGGCLVAPLGLIRKLAGNPVSDPVAKKLVEEAAMQAVIAQERALGYSPLDVSKENRGYDIESRPKDGGHLRFIEVKGRAAEADTVSVTCNEMRIACNEPENFILAIVEVDRGVSPKVHYVRKPFDRQPAFGEVSATFRIANLLSRSEGAEWSLALERSL